MPMYGTTLCGKYWYLDLLEYLLELGFRASESVRCLFMRVDVDGTQIYVLNYVDDMLYYGTNADKLTEFEKRLKARFNLETMGQAHWYLGTCINQLSNLDIELDQSRYYSAVVKKYLENAGAPKITRHHETPLALDFIPTADDCSKTEEEARPSASVITLTTLHALGPLSI
jgi:hypothetical protein